MTSVSAARSRREWMINGDSKVSMAKGKEDRSSVWISKRTMNSLPVLPSHHRFIGKRSVQKKMPKLVLKPRSAC